MIVTEIKLNQVICGKSEEKLKGFPDNFFDATITDPPYGMGFMNQKWDTFNRLGLDKTKEYNQTKRPPRINGRPTAFQESTTAGSYDLSIEGERHFQSWFYKVAVEMLRTAKPGSFLLCFGGTRTFHRVVCAIEDAGWIIKDQIMWLYGEGFPKSTNISKRLDKEAGLAEQRGYIPTTGGLHQGTGNTVGCFTGKQLLDDSILELAKQWEGYGTGLKPGWEPIIVAMKPLEKGLTYAQNAEKWGVAGLNIDGGRVGTKEFDTRKNRRNTVTNNELTWVMGKDDNGETVQGRWPANVILSHSPDCVCVGAKETVEVWACVPNCPIRIMDGQSGQLGISGRKNPGICKNDMQGAAFGNNSRGSIPYFDFGGASRFFYCAKAKRSEREAGLRGFVECTRCGKFDSKTHIIEIDGWKKKENCIRNAHPTVKPLDLMRYLLTLIKMPSSKESKQVILDPFCGSGTTLVAAEQLGINYIGIDSDSDSCLTSIGRIGV